MRASLQPLSAATCKAVAPRSAPERSAKGRKVEEMRDVRWRGTDFSWRIGYKKYDISFGILEKQIIELFKVDLRCLDWNHRKAMSSERRCF